MSFESVPKFDVSALWASWTQVRTQMVKIYILS